MSFPQPSPRYGPLRRAALFALQGALSLVILLDEIVRPLYRPLARWLSQRSLVARIEAGIATLPPYAVLALLALPFAIAEPLKIVGLVLMARGQALAGLVVLVLAYLASFLVVERIYQAGRAKLLTIGWFSRAMSLLLRLRRALLDWLAASPAGAFLRRVRAQVRGWWRGAGD